MSDLIETYRARADAANALLDHISNLGRRFFHHAGRVSRFEVDDRGHIWFIDKYTTCRLYCHGSEALTDYRFTEGGTLRRLCLALRDFIRTGKPLGRHLGPFPDWICEGDPWDYGLENMAALREQAYYLGLLPERQP